ncbi:MAG: ArsR/SmtB family transcription factor [Micromonosporaceae bacterium]
MLRIHFTRDDLARTRVAPGPDPLWEVTLSLARLQTRHGRLVFAPWQSEVRSALSRQGVDRLARSVLFPLLPRASYFPDFLTPAEGVDGFAAGVEAIQVTPRRRINMELRKLGRQRALPSWVRTLAAGDQQAMKLLLHALGAYHRIAVDPYLPRAQAQFDADRAIRTRAMLHGGMEGMLASLQPIMRWRSPVLEVDSPLARDIHLDGNGLLLIPSYFCWGNPVPIADPGLPQVLVYPVTHDPHWLTDRPAPTGAAQLAALIGATRAEVLHAVAAGATTGELAQRVGVTPAAVSQHTTVLRNAGLIVSQRRANTVLHTPTPLGSSLLNGASGSRS